MSIPASACEAFLKEFLPELGTTRLCDWGCHEEHCPKHPCKARDCQCWCHDEWNQESEIALWRDHCDHEPRHAGLAASATALAAEAQQEAPRRA